MNDTSVDGIEFVKAAITTHSLNYQIFDPTKQKHL